MFFCVYVYFWGEDDENTLGGALLPPDCTMSMTIAGVTKPERTAETGLCCQGNLSVILVASSTTTDTECGHSPPVRTLSGFQTASGLYYMLLDVIFQNHVSL